MAVSCPEVMYGAYYPYLYGRGAARSFHHAPHFQYDRLNVQSAGNAGEYGSSAIGGSAGGGAPALSSGSASSGAQSPGSPPHAHALPLPQHAHAHAHAHAHLTHAHTHPSQHHSPRLRTKEEDLSAHGRTSADGGGSSESEGECGGVGRARAQYVSANCVVFTHYSGDVAAVVDDHFTRALSLDKPKEAVPMASRNLPASFFNAAAAGPACAGLELYDYDPWHQHYAGYGHAHRHAAEYHAAAAHHNMAAAGYGGLLLGRGSLHAQYKPVDWPHAHAHAAHHAHAHHASPHLDPAACSPYSYPAPPGLEAQVQDTSKDLYWF